MASPQDLHDMAIAILAEGRGENKRGKEAIAHVINNRYQIQKTKGGSISEVVRQRLEFSGMRPKDSNRIAAQRLADQNAEIYKDAIRIANDVLTGNSKDPTKGATFYYADYIGAPKWAKDKTFSKVATIGRHKFYTAPKSEITAKTSKVLYSSPPIPTTSPAHASAAVPQPKPNPAIATSYFNEVAPDQTPIPVPRPGRSAPNSIPAPENTQVASSAGQISDAVYDAPPSVPTPRRNPMSRPGQLLEGHSALPSKLGTMQANLAAGLPNQFRDKATYKDKVPLAGKRKTPVNPMLLNDARQAVAAVFGSDHTVTGISGSQDPFGTGYNRTASKTTRHDRIDGKDYGNAVDVHITNPSGDRITGDALAPLAQYWAANNIGSIGVPTEGSTSSVHLDYIGGKGRERTPREAQIWAYPKGSAVPKAIRTAFNAGLEGTLPTLKEPQNAIHVSQGYAGPLHQIGYPIGQNVPPTPTGQSYSLPTPVRPATTSINKSTPLPINPKASWAKSSMAGIDESMLSRATPMPASARNTDRWSAPNDLRAGFDKSRQDMGITQRSTESSNNSTRQAEQKTKAAYQQYGASRAAAPPTPPAPSAKPQYTTKTVTTMERVPISAPAPAPTRRSGMSLDQVSEFAYGPTSMNVRQMNADAYGAKPENIPTPRARPQYEFKPVTKTIQVPIQQPKAPVPGKVAQVAEQEEPKQGFLSRLLGLPRSVSNGARVGAMVGGVPGAAMGAYGGFMMDQLGQSITGKRLTPTSPYKARGVNNPSKGIGLTNPARTRSASTSSGSGGPYEGETWRNTSNGGVRTFNPSTRQYEDYGGSNAGNRSQNQTTGSGGGGGGCFITTAAVDTIGELDNGHTLTTLRWFRDHIMANDPKWALDIPVYQHIAPIIVERLGENKALYTAIYNEFLRPAVKAIEAQEYERAHRIYKRMVDLLIQNVQPAQ